MENFDIKTVSKAVAALLAAPLSNLLGKLLGGALDPGQNESVALLIEVLVTAAGTALAVYVAPKNKGVK